MDPKLIDPEYFKNLQRTFPKQDLYKLWVVICQDANFSTVDKNFLNIFMLNNLFYYFKYLRIVHFLSTYSNIF